VNLILFFLLHLSLFLVDCFGRYISIILLVYMVHGIHVVGRSVVNSVDRHTYNCVSFRGVYVVVECYSCH
jgi:hypothetical protein